MEEMRKCKDRIVSTIFARLSSDELFVLVRINEFTMIHPHWIGPSSGFGKRRTSEGEEALQVGGDRWQVRERCAGQDLVCCRNADYQR